MAGPLSRAKSAPQATEVREPNSTSRRRTPKISNLREKVRAGTHEPELGDKRFDRAAVPAGHRKKEREIESLSGRRSASLRERVSEAGPAGSTGHAWLARDESRISTVRGPGARSGARSGATCGAAAVADDDDDAERMRRMETLDRWLDTALRTLPSGRPRSLRVCFGSAPRDIPAASGNTADRIEVHRDAASRFFRSDFRAGSGSSFRTALTRVLTSRRSGESRTVAIGVSRWKPR